MVIYSVPLAVSSQTDGPDLQSLTTARKAIIDAFNTVLDAEKTGANVTELINQLNSAAAMLNDAENSYLGYQNSTPASIDQTLILIIAQSVQTSAQKYKIDAETATQNYTWASIEFSVIGSITLLLILNILWQYTKKRSAAKNQQNSTGENRPGTKRI
jgi:hypothetical protein